MGFFVPEKKISVFCDGDVNHALPGVRSLAASPGRSALSPGGSRAPQNQGGLFLLSALGAGAGLAAWEALPSTMCVTGSQGRLETPHSWGLSGAAGGGIKGGVPSRMRLVILVVGRR